MSLVAADLGLAGEAALALDHRHQPPLDEALELLGAVPDVDDVQPLRGEPGEVAHPARRDVALPADPLARPVVLGRGDAAPSQANDRRHAPPPSGPSSPKLAGRRGEGKPAARAAARTASPGIAPGGEGVEDALARVGDGQGQVRDPVRGPVQAGLSRQALTRKFRRSPVQPPSAAGASLTHVVHSRPGLRSVVGRLRPGRLLAPASRRRFALHDGWTTRISPRGAAARRSRALSTLRPPPPGAIGGDPLHVAAHERVVTHLLAHHRRRVPRRELRRLDERTPSVPNHPGERGLVGHAAPRFPRRAAATRSTAGDGSLNPRSPGLPALPRGPAPPSPRAAPRPRPLPARRPPPPARPRPARQPRSPPHPAAPASPRS